MTTSPTPTAPVASDAQDWREKIARFMCAVDSSCTWEDEDHDTRIWYENLTDALRAGPIAAMQRQQEAAVARLIAAYDGAIAAMQAEHQREVEELHRDNQRLRWRHPLTVPEWNDLPNGLRVELAKLGCYYLDEDSGGDFAVQFYGALQRALSFDDMRVAESRRAALASQLGKEGG